MIYAFIKKGSFQDSVSLMLISRKLSESPGAEEVSVMMGTPANKALLESTGFWDEQFNQATANDICVAIKGAAGSDESLIDSIAEQLEEALLNLAQGQNNRTHLPKARRWATALRKLPDANLALISIAGEYAAEVCQQALESGRNVMIFSDNVSLQQELELKQAAQARGLLVMGPDCGTAMINGAPMAFANVIPHGQIGIIGASGTGIQELASQIALMGQGVTHAIGLGGRDLSAEVGVISALTALKMLAGDSDSKVIAFVSKPPAESVRKKMMQAMQQMGKPVVALFLGTRPQVRRDGNVWLAETLDEAARSATLLARVQVHAQQLPEVAGKHIIGLYSGGTLAAEAAMLLAEHLQIPQNASHPHGVMLEGKGHKIIDLGDDFYTQGKPHPMIDPTTRSQQIIDLSEDTEIGVVLLDVVLGYGAQSDPAGALVEAIEQMHSRRDPKQPLVVITTVTGSEQDPQQRSQQISKLLQAGIIVAENLPEAVLLAEHCIAVPAVASVPGETPALLQQARVINIGLRSFAENLQQCAVPVVHYQWAPIAGGNRRLAGLLKKLQ